MTDQEISALRWGGIAGILGSLLMLAVFGFLAAFVGLQTLDAEASIERFPEVRAARIIENTAYLLTLALWALHSATLLLAFWTAGLAPALAGCVMSLLGLTILATGAVPHTATTVLSDLYHAPSGMAPIQPVLVVAWEAIQGWVDAIVVTGLVLTPIGMGLFGLAMRRAPGFGPWTGWISLGLCLAGLVAAGMGLAQEGDIVGVGIFALVFFHLIVGWKSVQLPA
ncbi:MAG: hypothetical protein HKN63_02755 [Rhodobacteraceae bacterium]|nr:hypothetical protein [Paracoccaceae bacterium]